MAEMHRIEVLRPAEAPASLVIDWDDGAHTSVDLSGVIASIDAFAPLADPETFRQAEVIDYGLGVGWPGGLDYSAHSLRLIAEEQQPMTRASFIDWQRALGLSNREAADLLGVTIGTVKNFRAGRRIPKAVMVACRLTARDPTVFRAHYRPRKPGRPRKSV
ncbi:MAG: DUF2442 domain-containing protein [Alphaproteobacteria bacterium]